ncbi:MAG TPA: 2-C-methyl-D-erythritol 4-phosphate cytidylyltransferase [bacterium]|nr:2-C-methyl-D-erythritol 4-phosphate cytidylyltransferase [bacterium]
MPKTGAVIVAAGRSERMSGVEKSLAPLAGVPLLLHSVRAFDACDAVHEIVVVIREDLQARVQELLESEGVAKLAAVVKGGETRDESVRHGVSALARDVETVLVHDAARPLVTGELIRRVADAAAETGAALPGVPPVATIKREESGRCAGTVDRRTLREAQTPQGFRRDLLAKAFARAMKDGFRGTDEAACVERLGAPVTLVEGDRRNLKVTVQDDLLLAEALLSGHAPARITRIGFGRDVHRLVAGRPLILGGVTVPHDKGLDGWSDADVLSHAVCDALLGAAGAGDLGVHFPDTDDEWKGVTGAALLARTVEILRETGYVPVNVDATVSAQAPKLAPHRPAMVANLARAVGLPESRVSVKFTTTEGLGFEGAGEGISTDCVAMVGQVVSLPES